MIELMLILGAGVCAVGLAHGAASRPLAGTRSGPQPFAKISVK